jgi:hypothetical protein
VIDRSAQWDCFPPGLRCGAGFRSLDYLGNQEQPQSINFVVDTTPPTVSVNSPVASTYTHGQSVSASYSCADSGSGIATCAGTVPGGSSVDTSSIGQKNFTVVATDRAGNQNQISIPYGVTCAVCARYDQTKTHVSGSTVPIKLSLCDVNGSDASSPAITVTATALTEVST